MSCLKTVLLATFIVILSSSRDARGLDRLIVDQTEEKELSVTFDGLGMRDCDLYNMDSIKPGFLEEIYALGKPRRPDDLFRTALSDSAIVRESNGCSWLIRVFYAPWNPSPWKNTIWIGRLRHEKILASHKPSVFTISGVVPVRIPKAVAGFMDSYRATGTVISERKSQLEGMLRQLDDAVQNLAGVEEMIRDLAENIRKYGTCCPDDRNGEESNEEIVRKMERNADVARASMRQAIETRDNLRPVILRQLSTTTEIIRRWNVTKRE